MTLTRINEARFEVTLKDVGMENEGEKEEIRGEKTALPSGTPERTNEP